MRKIINRPLTAAFVLLMTIVMMLAMSTASVFAYGQSSSYADYTTEAFDVNATITKGHVIHMTEEITVNFSGTRHHGITRYIPVQSEYYKISNIESSGFDIETSHESNSYSDYIIVRMGDADEYLSGRQTFALSYDMICYRDTSNSADYLSLDLLPTGWETPIKSSTLTLAMPKSINWDAVKYYSGSYSKESALSSIFTKKVYTSANKVIITGKNLPLGTGVTVSSTLPEGYWVDPANRDWAGVILWIVLGIIPLLTLLLWFIFGRDPKVVRTVEFEPPEGMTPAEIGYIVDGVIDNKDMASMLMYFAYKGYLKINEVKRGTFEVTKLKDIDESEKLFAKTMFEGIFASGDTVSLDDMPEDFGMTLDVARDELKGYYKERENRLFKVSADVCRFIGDILMFIPAVAGVGLAAYEIYDYRGYLALIPTVILLVIGMFTVQAAYDKHNSRTRGKNAAMFIFGMIPVTMGVMLAAVVSGAMVKSWLLGTAVFLSMAVTYLLVLMMKSRTEQSAKWLGEILGFRDFIRDAEYDRLKALSDENPEYFYNIMPYAYVMGMDTKWAKKFENINVHQPGWYSTYDSGDFLFTAMWYSSMMHSCNRSFSDSFANGVTVDAGGFDGGGIGGGFGGGGFTGGGFGGGGGGAW